MFDIIPERGYNVSESEGLLFMYITVKQAAEKWGISDRRVRILCAEGKVSGVIREGRSWMIPADARKPEDGRFKATESLLTAKAFCRLCERKVGRLLGDAGFPIPGPLFPLKSSSSPIPTGAHPADGVRYEILH